MSKKNNLRRLYLIYMLVIGELFCAVFIVCSWQVAEGILQTLMRVIGFAGIALIPIVMFVFYKWLTKDGAATSDERERLVLTKGFAVAGFAALTLMPPFLLLAFLFPSAAMFLLLGYIVIIGGTCKFSVFYFYKKY
jgi:hypothetical protein